MIIIMCIFIIMLDSVGVTMKLVGCALALYSGPSGLLSPEGPGYGTRL